MSAIRAANGHIFVADGGGADVREFGGDGAWLRTLGRRGGGPGEFNLPAAIWALPGDSRLVADWIARRMSVFDQAGEFVRDFALSTNARAFIIGRFADGMLLSRQSDPGPDGMSDGPHRWSMLLRSHSLDGGIIDTIGRFPAEQVYMKSDAGDFPVLVPPFAMRTTVAVTGNSVAIGTGDAPEIRFHGADGRLVRILRTGRPPLPVTQERLRAFMVAWADTLEPDSRESKVATMRELPVPERLPAYGEIMAGTPDGLWVADADDPLAEPGWWTVYDRTGQAMARVRLPAGFHLLHVYPDAVLGVTTDELDVEHVRLYTLDRTGSRPAAVGPR